MEKNERNSAKKNNKRTGNFDSELKKRLAGQIRQSPRIWDVTNKLHSRKDAVDQAWTAVSEAIQRPVSECKVAWASMRESYRYHAKVGRKGKSGDPGGEALDEPHFDSGSLDWEFAEDMAFLPRTAQKRKTFQSTQSDTEIDDAASVRECNAQYDYETPSTSSSAKKCRTESQKPLLLQQLRMLIENQKQLQETREATLQKIQKYKEPLANFNWLLEKLPDDVAEKACEEINSYLLGKVSEEREKS